MSRWVGYIHTHPIASGVAAALQAMLLDPQVEGSEPLFQAVRMYDAPDLLAALEDLLVFEERVALVVPSEIIDETIKDAETTMVRRTQALTVIVSDVDYEPGPLSYFGDEGPGGRLGVVRLKDIVIDALAFADAGVPGVCLIPAGGGPQEVRREGESRTRRAWLHRFETHAGFAEGARFG